jgi:hypothetical protein
MLGIKIYIPDVIQRSIFRADLLHALGKFADVIEITSDLRMVLIAKTAYPVNLFPVRVCDSDAPAVREMEQGLIVAVDKADILFFGHTSSFRTARKCVSR